MHDSTTILLKYNGERSDIDINRIKGLLKDFLHSDDTYMPCFLLKENKKEDIAYGLEYYDELIRCIDEIKAMNSHKTIDRRPFHLIVELNETMQKRMEYLLCKGYIGDDTQLFDLLDEVKQKAIMLQSFVLKYNMTADTRSLGKMQSYIGELKTLQKYVFGKCNQAL